MYVGVIRGDLPGSLFLADLEQTSQTNYPTEPVGQTQYLARPNATALTNFLGGLDANYDKLLYQGSGGVPAGVESTAAITFPLTLTGSNNVLKLQFVAAGPFTACTIAAGTYSSMTSLLAAVNAALSQVAATATTDNATGTLLVIQSKAVGVGSYIAYQATGSGSTFNTPANLVSGGASFTMPTAATIITNLLPVGGPLNVSPANVLTYLGASPAAANAVQVIAPHFVETTEVIQSFQVGNMSQYLSPFFNPDTRLMPPLVNGAAITCVQDDGHTAYVAPLPAITGAVHNVPNPGDITITGTDLGNAEFFYATEVRVTAGTSKPGLQPAFARLGQKLIQSTLSGGTQGVVSPTSIVIPASLLTNTPPGNPFPHTVPVAGPALGVAGSLVEITNASLTNTSYGVAGSVTSAVPGATYINSTNTLGKQLVVTMTGLSNVSPKSVGQSIFIQGAASPGNNGSFVIISVVSSSSVTFYNPNAVAPDANNTHIVWNIPGGEAFVVT